METENLPGIFACFNTESSFLSATRIGSGHINDSYKVDATDGRQFVLQRINSHVFKDVPGLMWNIFRVTDHLDCKIRDGVPQAAGLQALRLIPAKNRNRYIEDDKGGFWRLYNYIAGTKSYDIVTDPALAFEGGRVFGQFQLLTADMPGNALTETIPHFHDIGTRLGSFRETIHRNPLHRCAAADKEICFIQERAEEMQTILRLAKENSIPLRVTHNDTKFNNILFDENNKAVCIVDLDTVMPGYVLYDFGDAIRTGANTGAEDEEDLSKVGISMELFEAYSRGYLGIAKEFLTETEKAHLAFSAKFMTYIIGLRFLTDYLNGDHYFRIHKPDHNLIRARAQFRLLENMEDQFNLMEQIIRVG